MTQHHSITTATGHVFLVKRKRGDQWYAKYRIGERQVQKKLGPAWTDKGRCPAGHYTKRTAQQALDAILTDARRGSLTAPTGTTFAVAANEYLRYMEQEKDLAAKTLRNYRSVIDGRLVPEFGDMALEKITPDLIDAWKVGLIGDVSNRVIVRYLTVMHGVFKRAKRVYGLADNPASADLVERPKVVYTGEFVTYERDQLDLLVGAAHDRQDGTLFTVAALTGLRQGELLALRWRDVDFVAGLVHVRRNYTDYQETVPKSKKVRSVPMVPDVVDALAKLKERGYLSDDDDLVFCNTAGDHLDSWALRRRFYAALKRAELPRIRFHDLRHHFGTAAITKLDAYAVQAYMGHAHYTTTARYLHHQPRREDAAKLHEAFGGKGVPNGVPNGDTSARTESNSPDGIPQ